MAKRIDATELERMIADDTVSDEVIAQYLKTAPVRGLPFQPMLVADETTVDAPPTRGIIGLTVTALNARANRQRLAAYKARVGAGWSGLKVLAEGDSWFLYPILLRDVVDNLSKDYAIYSMANAGDTLENMVRGASALEDVVAANNFDAMLLSAGGNDIAGDQLVTYLKVPASGSPAPADFVTPQYDEFLATTKARLSGIVTRLSAKFPKLHIFGHGYDWPFPHSGGLWLEPAFESRGIPNGPRAAILRIMIDRYYDVLQDIAATNSCFHVVDCRGTVGPFDQWFDELHPMNQGFARAAGKFRTEINRVFGLSAVRGGGADVKITWRPKEEKSGVRSRTRLFPSGAVVTIGRGHDREIHLEDDKVSRNHARLTIGTDDIALEDAESTNGTQIDGKPVKQAAWLPGQKLQIGHFLFDYEREVLHLPMPAAAAPPPGPTIPAAALPMMTLLTPVDACAAVPAAPADTPTAPPSPAVARGRRSISLTICGDSLTMRPSPAWVVGVFQNINPTRGAGYAVDVALDGALTAVVERHTIDARAGAISILPGAPQRGAATHLLMTGLGAIGSFAPKVMELAGEGLARALIETQIFEFATIPIGANSGLSLKDCVENFLNGFLRVLSEHDKTASFRGITICENNASHFAELKGVVEGIAGTKAFAGLGYDIALTAQEAPSSERRSAPAVTTPTTINPVILSVTTDQNEYVFTLNERGAAIAPRSLKRNTELEDQIASKSRTLSQFDAAFGTTLAEAYVPSLLQQAIEQSLDSETQQLVVQHDRDSAGIPWEAMFLQNKGLALDFGVSRRFLFPRDTPMYGKRTKLTSKQPLRILVLLNPDGNAKLKVRHIPGAITEIHDLMELFKANGCVVKALVGADATKAALLEELNTTSYDILHYAGHAKFDQTRPEDSGIDLSDDTLKAGDMAQVKEVPHLIFLNACESGRTRGASDSGEAGAEPVSTGHAGLAEAFFQRGVGSFIGTYWPVDDKAALVFSLEFYSHLLNREPLGVAVRAGRKAVAKKDARHWANYLFFGEPDTVLRKTAKASAERGGELESVESAASDSGPDPLAGEAAPGGGIIVFERGGVRGGSSDLPISRAESVKVTRWLKTNFGEKLEAAVQGTKFTADHLCAIVCQETAYFWVSLIDKLPVQTIVERCVLDACGDCPGTGRGPFPSNTAAFRARYGDEFTDMLIGEANKTRALRRYGPKNWVYKGYGLFQYDLQYVTTDEAFFRNREWASFDACLSRAMGELTKKYAQTGDVWRAIRSYNGSGPAAARYARNVEQFTEWCQEQAIA